MFRILLGLCLSIPTCAMAADPYNLLFISLDTVRADRLSCYGYARETSPHIDALAARSMRFTDCISPLPLTLPAHSSMLTGLHPAEHGLLENNYYADDQLVFLAELATDAGFETRAFVGAPFLTDKYNFTQGFEEFEAFLQHPLKIRGGKTVDRFETWLSDERDDDKPFFSFVHFYDVHEPYGAPQPYENEFSVPGASTEQMVLRDIQSQLKQEWFKGRYYDSDPDLYTLNAKYDEGIRYVDLQVQRLIDALDAEGIADQTIIVLTADHGEGLGDYKNDFYHGATVFQNTLHVPLIIYHPEYDGGTTRAEPVTLLDLFPTSLGFLGLTDPETTKRAHDLAPLLDAAADTPDWAGDRIRFGRSGPAGGANSRYSATSKGAKMILDERTNIVSWWRLPLNEPLVDLEQIRIHVNSAYRVELALEVAYQGNRNVYRFPSVIDGQDVHAAWASAYAEAEQGWVNYESTPIAEKIPAEVRAGGRVAGVLLNLGSASRFEGSIDNLEFRNQEGWRVVRSFELAESPLLQFVESDPKYSAGTPTVVSHRVGTERAFGGTVAEHLTVEFPRHPHARYVYNLRADPWEQRNIYEQSQGVIDALEPHLRSFFSGAAPGISQNQLKDAETMQELESLGYL